MTRDIFTEIYHANAWGSAETRSGPGSTQAATAVLRRQLVELFARYKIGSVLDIPCGDYNWMQLVNAPGYIGADVVPDLIASNKQRHPDVDFRVLDLTKDSLPCADLVITRDCLVHLSLSHAIAAIENIRRSGSKYLLSTSFTEQPENRDIKDGDWYPISLEAAPFNLPIEHRIDENCQFKYPKFVGAKSAKQLVLIDLQKSLTL